MSDGADRRAFARIDAELWISVRGLDELPQLRRGNLSLGGIFFVSDQPIGDVGTITSVQVAMRDWSHTVTTAAWVVRTARVDDFAAVGTTAFSVALSFMPESPATREAIERLMAQLVTTHLEEEVKIRVDDRFSVHVEHKTGEQRSVSFVAALPGDGLPATRTQIAVGDVLRMVHDSRGEQAPLLGRVVAVHEQARSDSSCRIEVDLLGEQEVVAEANPLEALRPAGGAASIADAVDLLFADLVAESPAQSTTGHLKGRLAHVPLTSLLPLLELERMTGELSLDAGAQRACLFVRNGQLVDVNSTIEASSPRETLAQIVNWDDGTFRFRFDDVDRPDRIGLSITALLLDIARESDEADRT